MHSEAFLASVAPSDASSAEVECDPDEDASAELAPLPKSMEHLFATRRGGGEIHDRGGRDRGNRLSAVALWWAFEAEPHFLTEADLGMVTRRWLTSLVVGRSLALQRTLRAAAF